MEKVKIILDADVLIHFSKAGKLSLLPTILPEYDYAILSAVYDETISIRTQIDNQIMFSLKKELEIAKVICKPPVLVPKTAQKSSLSKIEETTRM